MKIDSTTMMRAAILAVVGGTALFAAIQQVRNPSAILNHGSIRKTGIPSNNDNHSKERFLAKRRVNVCWCGFGGSKKCKSLRVHPFLAKWLVRFGATRGTCTDQGEDSVLQELLETIPSTTIDLFPNQVIDIVKEDSPEGFTPGELELGSGLEVTVVPGFEDYPVMSFGTNTNGVSQFSGFFSAEDGAIVEGTVARLYLIDGTKFTSTVDASNGYFSFTVTDVPPGTTPVIVTFTAPEGSNRRRQLEKKKERRVASGFSTPTQISLTNEQICAPGVRFTLTWDKPTSDIDLHVYEPNGEHVWYSDKIGIDGFLDVDDVEGFGPENYISTSPQSGGVYEANLHCYDVDSDSPPIHYTLVGRRGSTVVFSEEGDLCVDSQNDWSETYSITAGTGDSGESCGSGEDALSCAQCQRALDEFEDANRALRESPELVLHEARGLQEYNCNLGGGAGCDEKPPQCVSCMEQSFGFWCAWNHQSASDLLLEQMMIDKQSPTKELVAFYHAALFLPMTSGQGSNSYTLFSIQRDQILQENNPGKLKCAMFYIMEAYCDAGRLTRAFQYVSMIKTLARVGGAVTRVAAAGSTRDAVQDVLWGEIRGKATSPANAAAVIDVALRLSIYSKFSFLQEKILFECGLS